MVDLAHGVVLSSVDIHSAPASWQRIARWLMPSVAAKGGQSNGCTAVLDYDGTRLFLASYGREMGQSPDGVAVAVAAPQGVQVVNTSDLHLIRTLDIPDGQLVPTPDRRTLLVVVRDAPNEATAGATQDAPTRLIMFDTQTLGERGRATVADGASLVGFSADGRIVYLDGITRSPMSHALLLQVFSLDTRQIIAERTLNEGGGNLLLMRDW